MVIYVWKKNFIHLIYFNWKTARWWKYASRILHVVDTPYTVSLKITASNLIGSESVSKIVITNTMDLFYETAISILLISNHNIFRVLLFIYFI